MSIQTDCERIAAAKTAIKNSINAKGGTLTTERIDEYAAAIQALEMTDLCRVRFYDYDGTLLKTEYVQPGGTATPPVPVHEGLTFETWNNSYADVAQNIDTGAIYTTTSGHTLVKLRCTDTTGKVITFNVTVTSGTLTIDWGDDETPSVLSTGESQTVSHTYSDTGEYTVEISSTGAWNPDRYFCGEQDEKVIAVFLGPDVTTLPNYAFSLAYALKTLTMTTNLESAGAQFCQENYAFQAVVLPPGATIGTEAFLYCYSLSVVVWPGETPTIPVRAFYGCTSLGSAILPPGVTTVNEEAYSECYAMAEIILPAGLTTIRDSAFYSCRGVSEIIIPDSVTTLEYRAFGDNYAAKKIRLPAGLTQIPNELFYENRGIHEVQLPAGLTQIGSAAFYSNSLTGLTIPGTVTTIGSEACRENYALRRIDIPSGVTRIENSAFRDCYALRDIYCHANQPPTLGGSYVFPQDRKDMLIHVPASPGREILTRYQTASNWSYYADFMVEFNEEDN